MINKHERRAAQLGMSHGTASHRLRKQLLFKYVVLAGDNICYKCGIPIECVEDLSIEHKLPWEGQDTTRFWDLNNIAFSHLSCNRAEQPRTKKPLKHGTTYAYFKGCRCHECKRAKMFDNAKRY